MTASLDLRRALEKYLVATPDIPEIAWENQAFTPPNQQPWVQARLSMNGKAAAIGIDAPQEWNGTLRLVLHMPEKRGAGAADRLADALTARFASGTIITDGATRVFCGVSTRGLGVNEAATYRVPLEIQWRSYTGE